MKCPLCDTPLPDDARSCTRCDWVRNPPKSEIRATKEKNRRDLAALWLSLVPGLGHLYKGHLILGGVIFFIAGPLILALALSLAPGTLGLSLVIPMVFMFVVMANAYRAKDYRKQIIERAGTINRSAVAHH
jgi:hypothetical protein